MVTRVERDEVRRLVEQEHAQLVEVLPSEDYEELHLPGAISLPIKELDAKADQVLDRRRPIVVYCNDYL